VPGPRLLVGLGNPGSRYTETRHNAGFWFVERLVSAKGARFRAEARCHGDAALLPATGGDCRVLKPSTFMNDSGRTVRACMDYYRLDPDMLMVAHDEIDLPPGSARLKFGGGAGGHNGMRDIIECLGHGDFLRLRIGVGHPGHRDDVIRYVLEPAPVRERALIDVAIGQALEVVPLLFADQLQKAMTALHTAADCSGEPGTAV